jgi:hypothetical protein
MHHIIVIKVFAGDSEEGENLVRDALEDSLTPGNNTTGWEFVGDVDLITKEELQFFKVSSYKELEAMKKQEQKNNMASLIANLRQDILPLIAPLFMTKTDACLLISTKNEYLKERVETLLKAKEDVKRPDTFESIMDAFMKVLVDIAMGHSMAMWRMKQIKKMEDCFTEPLPYNTLQSMDNPYAELPCKNKKGLHPYYFLCDRFATGIFKGV